MFAALQPLEPEVDRLRQLVRHGLDLAHSLESNGRSELTRGLRSIVSRIEIRSEQISVTLQPAGLLALLRGSKAIEPALQSMAQEPDVANVLTTPLARRRAGRDTRLLVDAHNTAQADPALLRLILRGREFRAKLLESGESSLTEMAAKQGISRSYLTRLARLTFLSPEIVCAILDGRQPAHLSAARLSRLTHLPLDWAEQRKVLGFG